MKIHHVGYLTADLADSVREFKKLGFAIEKETILDQDREAQICFLVNGGYRVELIQPADKDSPLHALLKKYKNTPYHICYVTDNMEIQLIHMQKEGYVLFKKPQKAAALENGIVAFLMNRDVGMIEILEENDVKTINPDDK